MKINSGGVHDREHDRQDQRDRQRDHDAGAPAERQEAHQENDPQRLDECFDELGNGMLDDLRLVGDLRDLDPHRKLGDDCIHRGFEVLPQRNDVAAVLHGDAQAEGGLAALADDEARRVLVATLDSGDVAEAENPSLDLHGDRRYGIDAGERTGDAQVDAVRRGLDRAARGDGILPGHAVENLLRRDAQRRKLGVAQLNEDLLRPLADDVGFIHVRHAQEPLPDILDARLELRKAQAVRRQHIDCRIDVAVLVVEARPGDAGRQITLDVADLLADLVPEFFDFRGRRRVHEIDLDEGRARLRIGFHPIQVGQLLELFLDLVGDLGLHLGRGGPGPGDVDDHRLDGEGGILGAPKLQVGVDARCAENEDGEQHERLMRDRPFGEIEALHASGSVCSYCVFEVQIAGSINLVLRSAYAQTSLRSLRKLDCVPRSSG